MNIPAISSDLNILRNNKKEPFYLESANEVQLFEAAYRARMAVMLKGPTGCGKTRFVRYMAYRLNLPLYTVACHDDLTSTDLVGRYIIKDGETIWIDGPLTRAVRMGGICYLDEIVEARKDTTVIIHPLADDRRMLFIEKTGENIKAPPDFLLVISYNPDYQSILKDLKASTRQRFIAIDFSYPSEDLEVEIVMRESGLEKKSVEKLVTLGQRLRSLEDISIQTSPGTRLLIHAATLINRGIPPRLASKTAIIRPLTDDKETQNAMMDIVDSLFNL